MHQCNWDLWCSLECTPACQAGGRGFKSRQVRGRIAQLVERAPEKCEVAGSMPAPTTVIARATSSLVALVLELHLVQAAADFRCAKTTVPAERSNCSDLARPCPAGDGLGVDPEKLCHFSGGKKSISLLLLDHFGYLLSVRNLPQRYEPRREDRHGLLASFRLT